MLTTLHIQLGLVKQFVTALNQGGSCSEYTAFMFPGFTMDKPNLSTMHFDGPQIKQFINNPHCIVSIKSCIFSSSVRVMKNVFENKSAEKFTNLAEDLLFHFNRL